MRQWDAIRAIGATMLFLTGHLCSAQVVTKVVESFDHAAWRPSPQARAAGRVLLSEEHAPDVDSQRSLMIEVNYEATFGSFGAEPAHELWIPGDVQRLTLRYRVDDPRFGMQINFRDGWDRDRVAGKPLEWNLPVVRDGQWRTASFDVPADWVRPIRIHRVSMHNWADRNNANTVRYQLDRIEATTDLSAVDPQTGEHRGWKPDPNPADPNRTRSRPPRTPLVETLLTTDRPGNTFQDEPPYAMLTVRNWKPGVLRGTVNVRVRNEADHQVIAQQHAIEADSLAALALPLAVGQFDRYRLDVQLTAPGEPEHRQEMVFALIAPRRELTAQEKLDSPYGLNVHSGGDWPIEPYVQAGMVWFREYAFAWDWLARAKGPGDFSGWPYFPSIVKRFEDAGVHIMPVLQKSMQPPDIENGQVTRLGADRYWKRDLAQIILAFPTITHWELNNEYDLNEDHIRKENLVDWANYGEYHKAFAEVLEVLGGGELVAIENGQAGAWPERTRSMVERGYFERLDVVNTHHYCGVEAPEVNYGNFNTGFDTPLRHREAQLYFDSLRNTTRNARLDGKHRQHYHTEFGWDTLAGRVVSPFEQAVYLQRSWMMMLAAGVDKAFWFYHLDSATPRVFFDGCGLLDPQRQPKLALVALAGMTARLPSPTYIGDLNAGDGTQGYVFEQDGKLVAALWTIDDTIGRRVTIEAERWYDYLGNAIEGPTVQLGMAPVYAVGLKVGDAWHRQTAYSIDSDHLVVATAGDPVTPAILIHNNRDEVLACTIELQLPDGWRTDHEPVRVTVAAGDTQRLELPFVVDPNEGLGLKGATFVVRESAAGAEPIKRMPLRLLVQPPLAMQVTPIAGRPGQTRLSVRIANKSARPRGGTLSLQLPSTWSTASPTIDVEPLQPDETREIPVTLTWAGQWQADESASARFVAEDGAAVEQPIIPSAYRLHRAENIQIDGDLSDWPESTRVPAWMLGSTMGQAATVVHLAWANEGLYAAFEVQDSRLLTSDPRSFWAGDALELWIDTADDKTSRRFTPRDHQFWLVPMVEENRVWVGRWKRADEIEATQYDLDGVRSAARRSGDGYVMEFLIPAARLHGYTPREGGRLGLNFNLSIKGHRFEREVFWPRPKARGVTDPANWGSVELVR